MKKIVLFAIAALWMVAGRGQRPVGDTIVCPDSTYYTYIYDWCGDDHIPWMVQTDYSHWNGVNRYTLEETDPDGSMEPTEMNYFHGNGIVGTQYVTDRPLKIVGIAAPAYMEPARDTTFSGLSLPLGSGFPNTFPNTRDITLAGRITDSMILYKVTPDGGSLVELMAAGWRMEYPHRYIHLPPGKLGQPNEWPNRPLDSSLVVPLYEVMFEKPVVVEDTFVVAGTYLNNEGSWEWQCEPMWEENRRMMWLWNHCPTRYIDWKGEAPEPDSRRILWSKFRTAQWQKQIAARMNIYNTFAPFHSPLIFPIIEPGFDTTLCHDTRNIRVTDRTDSSATLIWDSGDGGPWEVAFGKMTDQWTDYTFTTTTRPTLTVTGLEVGTIYFAMIRSYCNVTHEYGAWVGPVEVEIYQHHNPHENGIDGTADGDRWVSLMPNPAQGAVNVLSSYRLNRIEVYNLKGEKVYEQKADGITAEFDVSGWAKGVYIVALYPEHGVVTKKLVVR